MKRRVASASGSGRRRNNGVTKKGRSTRMRVLKAGRRVVEKRGYFNASVTEITRQCGVALGTFYRYFDNKDDLFSELLKELVGSLYHSVGGSWIKGDELGSLRVSSQRYLQAYYENRKLIAAMIQMAGAVSECAKLWWDLRGRTYERMEQYIAALPIADQLDSRLIAVALGSMVEQFANYWFVQAERNRKPRPTVEQAAEVVSRLWYRAIYEKHPDHVARQLSGELESQ